MSGADANVAEVYKADAVAGGVTHSVTGVKTNAAVSPQTTTSILHGI